MRIPLWLKLGWTVWLLVWAPVFWKYYGAQNLLYFCDLGNLLIGGALWLESPLLVSWAATGLLVFQTLYVVDLAGALVGGVHLIGGTEYMFDGNLPLGLRLLSLFHVVTPPLLLWGVHRLGYDNRGWRLQTLMTWLVVPINYFWRPQFDVNWARGPHGHQQYLVPGLVYLLAYLIVIPLVCYWPTHLLLQRWVRGFNSTLQQKRRS